MVQNEIDVQLGHPELITKNTSKPNKSVADGLSQQDIDEIGKILNKDIGESTVELTQKELFNIAKQTKNTSKPNKTMDFLTLEEWNQPLLVPNDDVIKVLNKYGAKIDVNKPIDLELINKYIETLKKSIKPKIFD